MKILYGKVYYRPREIAERGLITNSKGEAGTVESNYTYILDLIRTGDLKAINVARGRRSTNKNPHYMVPEDEIERFNKEMAEV